MAAVKAFSSEIPERIVLEVPVPQRLTTRNIQGTVEMAASHLRFLLSQRYQVQVRERCEARCEAQDARRAAREARLAEAEEAGALANERDWRTA